MASVTSSDNCSKCTNVVSNNDKGIQCELCQRWFHAPCASISARNLDVIAKLKNVHWFCDLCDSESLMDELKDFRDFRSQHKKLSEDLDELARLAKRNEDAIADLQRKITHDGNDNLHGKIVEIVREERDMERRKFNLCVFGLCESPEVQDRELFNNICSEKLGILLDPVASPVSCTKRIGSANTTKPRILIVTLNCLSLKNEILKNAPKLKDIVFPGSNAKVFISPDQTKLQREQRKTLRIELKARLENGENVMISQNKIVPRNAPIVSGANAIQVR